MWVLGAGVVAAAVAARLWLGDSLDFKHALTTLRVLGDSGWAPLFFWLAYATGTMIFVPAVGFHALAGVTWGLGKGIALAWVGMNIGSNLQFALGRWAGQKTVSEWLHKRGYGALLKKLEGEGAWTMVWVRQLPLPFFIVNLAAGASPMKWWHFLVGSGLGGIPAVTVSTYFAAQLIEGVEGAQLEVLFKSLGLGAGLLLVLGLMRYWARRNVPVLKDPVSVLKAPVSADEPEG